MFNELLNFKFRSSFLKHHVQKTQSMILTLLNSEKVPFPIVPFLVAAGHKDKQNFYTVLM